MDNFKSIFNLNKKTSVVVGGAGGIGQSICMGLAEFGSNLVIVDRNKGSVENVVEDLKKAGYSAIGITSNILNVEDLNNLVKTTLRYFDKIDVLINSAGTQVWSPAEEYKEEDWDEVVDLNLKGTFLTCQAVGRVMIKQKSGSIINISSVRGQLGIRKGYSAYCASKAGVNLLTKQLACEWGKYGIRVNAVAPTFVKTKLVENVLDKEFVSELENRIPLGKICSPDDIVGPVIFLASEASSMVSGHILLVDGGVTACQ